MNAGARRAIRSSVRVIHKSGVLPAYDFKLALTRAIEPTKAETSPRKLAGQLNSRSTRLFAFLRPNSWCWKPISAGNWMRCSGVPSHPAMALSCPRGRWIRKPENGHECLVSSQPPPGVRRATGVSIFYRDALRPDAFSQAYARKAGQKARGTRVASRKDPRPPGRGGRSERLTLPSTMAFPFRSPPKSGNT